MALIETNSTHISDLYNFSPAFRNRYEVTISSDNDPAQDYIKLHATSVDFGDESISLMRNPVTKAFHISASEQGNSSPYKRNDMLTITWRESDLYDVKKYHEEWVGLIYDRKRDVFKSLSLNQVKKLYKTLVITFPTPSLGEGKFESIRFNNVLPNNIGDLSFSWGSKDIITRKMSYYVESWEWVTTGSGRGSMTQTEMAK